MSKHTPDSSAIQLEIQFEEWRYIPGTDGLYQVSNYGRVKALFAACRGAYKPGRILKWRVNERGYPIVGLFLDGKRRQRTVHTLVAAAFIGQRPAGLHVNHKNGIKTDIRPKNLEYITNAENIRHRIDVLGVHPLGEKHHNAKLKDSDVIEIRRVHAAGNVTFVHLAKIYGVDESCIRQIVKRQKWTHLE